MKRRIDEMPKKQNLFTITPVSCVCTITTFSLIYRLAVLVVRITAQVEGGFSQLHRLQRRHNCLFFLTELA